MASILFGNKRFQVFLSSTYKDLIEERRQVIHTLVSLDCFPIAMEHFPASYEQQWDYIKPQIESSDIFICLIGGKYGSCDSTGLSFTQREFEHAVKVGIPTLVFYPENPNALTIDKAEDNEIARQKLRDFLSLAKGTQLCKPWKNADQLQGLITISVVNAIRHFKPHGWRSCRTKSKDFMKLELECSELKNQFEKMQLKARHAPINSYADYDETVSTISEVLKCETEAAIKSGNTLKIRMLGVCLHKSLPTLRKFLITASDSLRIEIRIAVLHENIIKQLDARWANLHDLFLRDFQDLVSKIRARKNEVNVSIKLYTYQHMPNWHGILIAYRHLFLGHCLWHEDGTLTAGQNPYDQYLWEHSTTHDRKINQYLKWFDYCRVTDGRVKDEQLVFDSNTQTQ